MKALYFEKHGPREVLQYGELPRPKPHGIFNTVLRVEAVALNHLDIWVRRGWPGLKLSLPHIGGSDIVGEVIETVSESPFQVGTKVLVQPGYVIKNDEWTERGEPSVSPNYRIIGEHVSGGLAEFVLVPHSNLEALPSGRSIAESAAGALTGLTCYRMLFTQGALKAGQKVLVVGSGGGVNSLAIQMIQAVGAEVIALGGSKAKCEHAKKLGASHVINYRECVRWGKEVLALTNGRGVDIVVDNVGATTMPESLKAVAPGGRIVTVGNTSGPDLQIDNRYIFSKQISIIGSTMGSAEDFRSAQKFLVDKGIHPVIDCELPLSRGIEAFDRMERGEHFGKIVLRPGG